MNIPEIGILAFIVALVSYALALVTWSPFFGMLYHVARVVVVVCVVLSLRGLL